MSTKRIREALDLLRRYAVDHPAGLSVEESNLFADAEQEANEADETGRKHGRAVRALEALTNPEGHIWHGSHGPECTGECSEVRAVLSEAKK